MALQYINYKFKKNNDETNLNIFWALHEIRHEPDIKTYIALYTNQPKIQQANIKFNISINSSSRALVLNEW